MLRLPELSDVSNLVATLDRHPFGALATIVLAGIIVVAILAIRRLR